ncbi:MAG: hypothetical protein R3Y56_09420, partial [Akkermansia sp.]
MKKGYSQQARSKSEDKLWTLINARAKRARSSKGRIGSASFVHSGESKDFTYNYIEGTSLLQSLVHPNGITTTNTYEASRNL